MFIMSDSLPTQWEMKRAAVDYFSGDRGPAIKRI
jgi:hypothetical protein